MLKEAQKWETKFKGASLFADGSAIIRPLELPWTDGPLEGLSFRLNHIDRQTGGWTAFIKAGPNAVIPAHFNHGQVQTYIREGSFSFDGHELRHNDFYLDQGGVASERVAGPEGVIYYVVFEGGFSRIGDDNKPTGTYIDCNYMYDLAAGNNAAEHLSPPKR
ncbi:cupin domain-containing protein [Novosphingobium mangrovi (ex Huang et al. 2023)]|uniref:ChrR-like cupin domain-containing protein n=1 Tax=Novosphingobium mangrovi (ex Huang et al. 2023) TaxID=2976432 RepID=A0ABT2I8N6_9SPHN|nr:hypothetical protein [Novosphingobium mangrovi (ex Huang et al. 2023)]MCT2401192.1 hypothetical protein [Novosphingobium mangrovi (ex Huang et al. 2023)]